MMRPVLVFALLLLAVPAQAQNYLRPAECMEAAGDIDAFIRELDKPTSRRVELQEQLGLRQEGFKKLCFNVYWCDEAKQAITNSTVDIMKAMTRYCPHKQRPQQHASWEKCREFAMVLDMAEAICMGEGEKGKPACTDRAKNEDLFNKHCVEYYACHAATVTWKKESGYMKYVSSIEEFCDPQAR